MAVAHGRGGQVFVVDLERQWRLWLSESFFNELGVRPFMTLVLTVSKSLRTWD